MEAEELPNPDSPTFGAAVADNNILDLAALRFRNIKWENMAFCGFQVWFLGMAFDAVSCSYTCVFFILSRLYLIMGKFFSRLYIRIVQRF